MKFCASYSCGKDSTLALHRMVNAGHQPVALIVTVNEEAGRSWFHGVGQRLLQQVSESLDIPLITARCGGDNYESAMEDALKEAKALGAEACVFGDIDIADHLEWNKARCEAAGIDCELPLWQEDRRAVVDEFIAAGYKAIIKTVSKQHGLDRDYLGKVLSKDIVNDIAALGLDPCGEQGEYHTFCCDGPLFSSPIVTIEQGVHESPYAFSLILEAVDET